jgi:hypothetical protein
VKEPQRDSVATEYVEPAKVSHHVAGNRAYGRERAESFGIAVDNVATFRNHRHDLRDGARGSPRRNAERRTFVLTDYDEPEKVRRSSRQLASDE